MFYEGLFGNTAQNLINMRHTSSSVCVKYSTLKNSKEHHVSTLYVD